MASVDKLSIILQEIYLSERFDSYGMYVCVSHLEKIRIFVYTIGTVQHWITRAQSIALKRDFVTIMFGCTHVYIGPMKKGENTPVLNRLHTGVEYLSISAIKILVCYPIFCNFQMLSAQPRLHTSQHCFLHLFHFTMKMLFSQ